MPNKVNNSQDKHIHEETTDEEVEVEVEESDTEPETEDKKKAKKMGSDELLNEITTHFNQIETMEAEYLEKEKAV